MTDQATRFSPLHKTVVVPWSVERAFTRFTAELGSWWPLKTHSVGGPRTVRCVFEGRVGGEIYEELKDGTRCVWGTVMVWEPPGRTVFTWHPDRTPETAQNVEVRFTAEGNGTRLDLVHTGWERLGAEAKKARRAYPLGWTYVLNWWAGRERSAVNRMMDVMVRVMMFPIAVWQWTAGLLLLANLVAALIAYRREEALHGHIHTALALLSVWWLDWLWKRARLKASPPVQADQR